MGAGASQQHVAQQPSNQAAPVAWTRGGATAASFELVAKMVGQGFPASDIEVRATEGGKTASAKEGFVWGDVHGISAGRSRNGAALSAIPWDAPGLSFSSSGEVLEIACDGAVWKLGVRNAMVAKWLSAYLHAFLPDRSEYTVVFHEWGALGIRFAMYSEVVIPVVFTIDDPAKSLGVRPASVLHALNGELVSGRPEQEDFLDFVSSSSFPKTLLFKRPTSALDLVQEAAADVEKYKRSSRKSSGKSPVTSPATSPKGKEPPSSSPPPSPKAD